MKLDKSILRESLERQGMFLCACCYVWQPKEDDYNGVCYNCYYDQKDGGAK
jgi:hypothetical protein